MEQFFKKKYIFAAAFIVVLFLYSFLNFYFGYKEIFEIFEIADFETIDTKNLMMELEDELQENLLGRNQMKELYGYLQKLMGKQEIEGFTYVKDKGGVLYYTDYYREDMSAEYQEYAKRVRRLQKSVAAKGTEVLYVAAPGKYIAGISDKTEGYPIIDTDTQMDEFLLYLNYNGVKTLDLRENLRESGMPYEEIFYRTDDCWTTQASFEAYGAIMEKLNSLYEAGFDQEGFYRNGGNYNITTYEDQFVGSFGRKIGIAYCGTDDLTIYTPKFKTYFEYDFIKSNGELEHLEGDFEHVFINQENLYSNDYYHVPKDGVYLGGLHSYEKIVNGNNRNGPKILCIRDEFFTSTTAFLASQCSEMDIISPADTNQKQNIEEYVEHNTYDYILIMLQPGSMKDESFGYFKKP